MISPQRLRELVYYDPLTGQFWRKQRKVCRAAGAKMTIGYLTICVDFQDYYAHRLAWFYVHGRWPVEQIDHINGVKDDNRIANLREATRSDNMTNKAFQENRHGYRGVSCYKTASGALRYRAKICKSHKGGSRWIGRVFLTPEEAAIAYAWAAADLHGEFFRP